tara:strand:+ start:1439 stop:1570 length:132 start_codon:yes stop_codon:yes gene_type:complete
MKELWQNAFSRLAENDETYPLIFKNRIELSITVWLRGDAFAAA